MTWAEFKKQVEEQGVTDKMTVGMIDVFCPCSDDEENPAPLRVKINSKFNEFSVT